MEEKDVLQEWIGKTLSKVIVQKETKAYDYGNRIMFEFNDGSIYEMLHIRDCCEWVEIDDIEGDIIDIIGSPITSAYTSESESHLPKSEWRDDSCLWTFYRINTAKGGIVIRWYGSSNGYYSESVDVIRRK